jgi:hypothetical protein
MVTQGYSNHNKLRTNLHFKISLIEPNGGGIQSFEEGEIFSQAERWAFTEVRMVFREDWRGRVRLNIAMHKLIPSQPNLIQGNQSKDLKVMYYILGNSTRWCWSKNFVQITMGWEPKSEEFKGHLELRQMDLAKGQSKKMCWMVFGGPLHIGQQQQSWILIPRRDETINVCPY